MTRPVEVPEKHDDHYHEQRQNGATGTFVFVFAALVIAGLAFSMFGY